MVKNVKLDAAFALSDDIVSREIEGELIIVPLAAGIGDLEDELYTLNETGRAIWEKMDGKKSLKDIIEEIRTEYQGSVPEIEQDVIGLIEELLKRKIIVESNRG